MKSNKTRTIIAGAVLIAVVVLRLFTGLKTRTIPPPTRTTSEDPWDVIHIEKSQPDQVTLRNGKVLGNVGYDLDYLGKMDLPTGPILLFSGQTCMECDEGLNLLVYSVASDATTWSSAYPSATATGLDDGKVFYEGRAFFGQCLPGLGPSVVAYVHAKRNEIWKDSVFTYAFHANGAVEEKEITDHPPAISESLKEVSHATCEELPHHNYAEE